MKIKQNNLDKLNREMQFRVLEKLNIEQIRKYISYCSAIQGRTKTDRNAFESNILNMH